MSRLDAEPDQRRGFSLRLFAWRHTISPDKDRILTAEPYDCDRDCRTQDGSWNEPMRASRGCTLFGAPPVDRKPTAKGLYQLRIGSPYMGRYPDPSLAGTKALGIPMDPQEPFEPPENGCPGAWSRSRFVDSLFPFMRRRTRGGGRVHNPNFDRAHSQIQDAVRCFEIEEERAIAYIKAAHDQLMEAKRRALEGKQ